MSSKDNSGKYWPYMILGFLFIGITLGYWTVKSAISLPVQESNEFLKKYQDVEKKGREIQEAEDRFNKLYKSVEFAGLEKSDFKEKNIKRKPYQYYKLEENNSVWVVVKNRDNKAASDVNVTLLLTRPQTIKDDQLFTNIPFKDGAYRVDNLKINKKGRYILRFRFQKGDAFKYLDIYAIKE